jgi:hypothetical protein
MNLSIYLMLERFQNPSRSLLV